MAHDEPTPVPAPTVDRWASPWSDALDEQLAEDGYDRVRLLHQMRRPLPLPDSLRSAGRHVDLRGWRPSDADGVLGVNNRAFAWHPEQGGWDRSRLDTELAEDWFDPEGLLVHEGADGRIDGFCWTKVHPPLGPGDDGGPEPAMGEIYVIAADPAVHGTGLGRALTVAGLDHLSTRGLRVGMLYVEADNQPAVRLYRALGFEVHHSDAGYVRRRAR